MAEFSNGKTYSTMGLPMNITRGNPIPVDATEVWYSLEDAQTYAASGATAYVGQSLKVVDEDNGIVTTYVIKDTAGTLVQLADADAVDAAIAAIPEIEAIPDSEIIALCSS